MQMSVRTPKGARQDVSNVSVKSVHANASSRTLTARAGSFDTARTVLISFGIPEVIQQGIEPLCICISMQVLTKGCQVQRCLSQRSTSLVPDIRLTFGIQTCIRLQPADVTANFSGTNNHVRGHLGQHLFK